MANSTFTCCKFDKTDLTGVDASNSAFVGGSMIGTKCTRTNFMNTQLLTRFEPSDCLGMTLTLECSTFNGMTISNQWWFGWLYFAIQMTPAKDEGLRDKVKEIIGFERFLHLERIFKTRQI